MTSAIGCRCTTVSLATFAELQALATERTLVDLAFAGTRKWQSERLQFKDDLWRQAAHVLDRILVAEPIGTFDCVIRMPTPIIFSHICQCTVNPTLSSHSVRASWEDLADA